MEEVAGIVSEEVKVKFKDVKAAASLKDREETRELLEWSNRSRTEQKTR